MEKNLYHYTSAEQLELILEAGYLKLTPSNLIKPIDAKIVQYDDGNYGVKSEISDSVKPVVWLTDSLNPDGCSLTERKKQIRIIIPMKSNYEWWLTWAEKNRMNKKWMKDFTKGLKYGSWYVSEKEIPLEDVLRIENVLSGEIIWEHD